MSFARNILLPALILALPRKSSAAGQPRYKMPWEFSHPRWQPPQEFIDVLRHVNGFEWNGFILYGVDRGAFLTAPEYSVYGLIEQNEIWYEVESQRAYLFLGESNISWYVYEIATGRYMELDNPSGQEMTAFGSCAEMLEKLLDDCLN